VTAFKPDGSRWFAPTTDEREQELGRAADVWMAEQLASGGHAGQALLIGDRLIEPFEAAARAAFAPLEDKVRELIDSPEFAAAVMRGVCPYCGAACADVHDEAGLVTMHQAPPCDRFAALRPPGGATMTVEFVGYLLPPSPGVGVHLYSEVAVQMATTTGNQKHREKGST